MDNISILLERLASGSILMNNNVIYDGIIEQDGNIDYDVGTGVVTLFEAGKYCVFWWVATQTGLSTNGTAFNLIVSQSDPIVGNSPIKSDEPTGFGIVNVNTVPVTLSIQNSSNNTIYYSSTVQTKASLMIVKMQGASEGVSNTAYGGLYGEVNTPFTLEPGENVQIPFNTQMVFENMLYGASNIEIVQSGNYQINYMVNFGSAGSAITGQTYVRRNALPLFELSQAAMLSTNSSLMINANAIVSLNEGDIIDLYLVSAIGGVIQFVPETNVILTINKVSSN